MSRTRRPIVVADGVNEHPAVKAWVAATSQQVSPECVVVFRERTTAAIYGLPALGAGGGTVIAKRSRQPRSSTERYAYEAILPHLPLTTPRYYGAVANGEYGWIFVEHVGSDRYRQDEQAHREIAARWLATMHTAAAHLPAVRSLPDAGPGRYLQHLRAGRERILRNLRAQSFTPNEIKVLRSAVAYCDALEERWVQIDAACREGPNTLVHCDFQPKNAYMRTDHAGPNLWLIDWEMAGFGSPAADLTRIDLRTYWMTVRADWPRVTYEHVQRLASAGHVLQWTAAVDWESVSLECARARDRSDAVDGVELSVQRLAAAARSAGVFE